jgi:hypothetical protein
MNTAHCTPGAVGRAFSNVDFDSYDRSALHRDELTILDDEKIGVQGSKWQRTGRPKLQRLVRPIEDVCFGIDLTGYRMRPGTLDRTRVRFSSDSVWGILSQVLRTRRVYWEWSEREWAQAANFATGNGSMRVRFAVVGYVLCGVRPYLHFKRFSTWWLARMVFGEQVFQDAQQRIAATLQQCGYASIEPRTTGGSNLLLALGSTMLKARSERLDDITTDLLLRIEDEQPELRSLHAISVALTQLHILDAPLSLNRHCQDPLPETWVGVPEQWAHFAREWSRRATYTETTVQGVEGHLRKVGRWLADNHPEATRPENWTPQIAAHFVKAATEMTTGEYLPDYQSRRIRTPKGKPSRPTLASR